MRPNYCRQRTLTIRTTGEEIPARSSFASRRISSLQSVIWRDLQRGGFDNCAIATSDDTPAALVMIERFKAKQKPTIDGQRRSGWRMKVSTAPPITHIALLTHIRSVPWIAQAIARAMRVDEYAGPYERQRGHVLALHDAELLECIAKFKEGDRPLVVVSAQRQRVAGGGAGRGGGADTIVPVDAAATTMRSVDFGTGDETDPREEHAYRPQWTMRVSMASRQSRSSNS